MPDLYAQPYDITANGFHFDSAEDFAARAKTLRNAHGDPVEEFEIQFIDGEAIDCELAGAINLTQANYGAYLECCDKLEDWQKCLVILAVGECGYGFDPDHDPADYDIDVYHVDSLWDLAEQFVADGFLGEVPESLLVYFDDDAFARDLSVEYSETIIAGQRLVWRAG
ncbi:MAG: antirestriction protein ArdA [Pseudomonadota bacterium]